MAGMAQGNDRRLGFSHATPDDFSGRYDGITLQEPGNLSPSIEYEEAWRVIWDLAASSFDCVASTFMFGNKEWGLQIAIAPIAAVLDRELMCECRLQSVEANGYADYVFQKNNGINTLVIELKDDLENTQYTNYRAQLLFELMAAWEMNYPPNTETDAWKTPLWGILLDRYHAEVFKFEMIDRETKEGSIWSSNRLSLFMRIENPTRVVPSIDLQRVFDYILQAVNDECVQWSVEIWQGKAREIRNDARRRQMEASTYPRVVQTHDIREESPQVDQMSNMLSHLTLEAREGHQAGGGNRGTRGGGGGRGGGGQGQGQGR
ncbi:hypothetical protein VaNZ11_009526, partial [Volvox africanus]